MRRTERRTSAGFTFIWVLVSIALVGLGLTVGATVAKTTSQRDKERELLAIGRQFRDAIRAYYETRIEGRGREYPASLDDLVLDRRFPGTKRHLRKVFVDPMTGRAEWGYIRVAGRIAGVHSLSEAVPLKQAGFSQENATFNGRQHLSEWVFTYPADLMLQPAPADAAASAAPRMGVQ